ncbi:MAG: type II toxin-antitoxin system Phd/YefM family antitoxin [Polyangia bacterium]
MDSREKIRPVTDFKTRSAELIKNARESGRPVVITQHGRATAVLQDFESFERQRETLLLLKALVQGDLDYREGRSLPHPRAKQRLAALLPKQD